MGRRFRVYFRAGTDTTKIDEPRFLADIGCRIWGGGSEGKATYYIVEPLGQSIKKDNISKYPVEKITLDHRGN
jgi:hypothetical protein